MMRMQVLTAFCKLASRESGLTEVESFLHQVWTRGGGGAQDRGGGGWFEPEREVWTGACISRAPILPNEVSHYLPSCMPPLPPPPRASC